MHLIAVVVEKKNIRVRSNALHPADIALWQTKEKVIETLRLGLVVTNKHKAGKIV
eukprot:COSAG01_NODE_63622_length_279_cov_0.844444_1_plen_55_part_00